MKIRYSFERGVINVSRLRVISLHFSNFILYYYIFLNPSTINLTIIIAVSFLFLPLDISYVSQRKYPLYLFIYKIKDSWVNLQLLSFSRVICKFASENVAKENRMIDEKIRTRDRQSFSVYRRVLAVKWPMSFIGAIKGSLIRNETLKENLTIIPH